jgi:hypothetical protein
MGMYSVAVVVNSLLDAHIAAFLDVSAKVVASAVLDHATQQKTWRTGRQVECPLEQHGEGTSKGSKLGHSPSAHEKSSNVNGICSSVHVL